MQRTVLVFAAMACSVVAGCDPAVVDDGDPRGRDDEPEVITIDEDEPNNGPDAAGAQDVGTFANDTTVVITGELATGGSNGQQYTGDFDVFAFNVTEPGAIDVEITWTGSADVDFGLYDANLTIVASEGATAKPAIGTLAFAQGRYLLGLFSKDAAAPYTLTITYEKAPAGNGDCPTTPVIAAAPTGGCNLTLVTPVCATGDITGGKTFELAWSTNQTFCEGPHTLLIAGDPPSSWQSGNVVEFSIVSTIGPDERQGMTRNIGGYLRIGPQDLDQLTSSNGIYHYQVLSFGGSASETRAFHIIQ